MNSMCLDVDLRTDTKETSVQKRMEYNANHSRLVANMITGAYMTT